MQFLQSYYESFISFAQNVLSSPLDPKNRIYFLYLASSVLIAFPIYLKARKKTGSGEGEKSFVGFLFPKKVWKHPSAWLDVRYFFFHMLIGHFLLLGLAGFSTLEAFRFVTGGAGLIETAQVNPFTGWGAIAAAFGFMVVAMTCSDFISFYVHYLQHKIPVLWQFHKVHHSAEVMHPLSNFREHPVDNLFYMAANGVIYGVTAGVWFNVFGFVPNMPTLLGVPLLMFLFNFVGYNLRHSHIWLRWPGVWSKVFPSPAHHHVHHSCHPDHLDKNFAFMFPVWDVLFGTYAMPEDNRDVKFGVTEKDRGHELNSCLKLYFVPVKDAMRVLTNRKRADSKERQPKPDRRHPAE
ncbi:sterol desaturase family protein [Ruegeria sediminis]|uniref:Sterol desaturase family protein n=1 Tax=Ruegeria sediminis TaxID=2583820 RepID=A0ABY2X494_9RHOB|nr:sterol desaturase family protein [Ruegeria sediminis]TMV10226.1 sterol desaturase family protein [Ruegeria sediminis]